MTDPRLRECLRECARSGQPCAVLAVHSTTDIIETLAERWPHGGAALHWVRVGAGATHWRRHHHPLHAQIHVTHWGELDTVHDSIGQFHGVYLGANPSLSDAEHEALARQLRRRVWRHAWLLSETPMSANQQAIWSANGWFAAAAPNRADAWAMPRWPLPEQATTPPPHAIVIGAGLAGAATVAELTERGWQVNWLDAGNDLAQGASALPVGMLSPHPTAQPTPMSELTELGMAATVDALQQCLPSGEGWCTTQVDDAHGSQTRLDTAYLIEPATLVRAWSDRATATGRLRWQAQAPVARVESWDGQWHAIGPDGERWAQAPVLIVASAYGARDLLGAGAQALRAVAGQMSWAPLDAGEAAPATHPRRDHGVLSPDFSGSRGRLWAIGSTYRRGVSNPTVNEADHDANRDSLHRLCPEAVERFDAQRAQGLVHGFVGVRCATPDRMPLLGPVAQPHTPWPHRGGLAAVPRQPGLYVFAALGSRGLTLAAWGAQSLADLITGAPLATPAHLVHACDPARKSLRGH